MIQPLVIVLCGVRGSGKSTIGKILRNQYDCWEFAFADRLKTMIKTAFPTSVTHDMLHGASENREKSIGIPLRGLDPRDGAQMLSMPDGSWMAADGRIYPAELDARTLATTLGTEWGRRLYEDIWVNAVHEAITEAAHEHYRFVVTDGRFANEVRSSREKGWFTVKLLRGMDAAQRLAEQGDVRASHPSETGLFDLPPTAFDHILDNRGELDELPKLIDDMWRAAVMQHRFGRG
jgi:hypothetical protein